MKKFSPLKVIHLILMIGLMLCSGFSTVMFLGGFDLVVAVDIAALVVMLIIMATGRFDFGSIIGVIAALVADATLGLAIHGKYADKASRGTK